MATAGVNTFINLTGIGASTIASMLVGCFKCRYLSLKEEDRRKRLFEPNYLLPDSGTTIDCL